MFDFWTKTTSHLSKILGAPQQKITQEELENTLIESDMDYDLVQKVLSRTSKSPSRAEVDVALHNLFRGETQNEKLQLQHITTKPLVELIIGVNGAGKTTTIAKLTKIYLTQHQSVLLGAGDTFRAAASEQLMLWAQKLGVNLIATTQGSDPSAVAYDTIKAAIARKIDRVIIDTAGRLHNQVNLKKELEKIDRICAKALDNQPFRKILVLDGTQGSAAINQAKIFSQTIHIDGVIVTKLDGTSKGGAIFSIINELKIPILFLGIGEGENDLVPFDEQMYINGLLDCIFGQNNGKEK
ncbi:signal recognition particle-docking protein FtsY [Helicobacter fennelliae]|uniref:Signal recognition particle receptor FtsY n=1 Tax=Helicobacter fennelliae MRY12-0050 TaxID=1325130 RepID=T1DX92_9HELI|nr:signal recognition particle-docking protein FtsY [Helicobacter fennelliae]GAD20057.1 signal recognition particle receptor protein FtsY [Helicobacter fennelliae MRY12-0050]STP07770.1 signal recognition particle receptor protein [Helicobacter fennelliae]STQ84546.1 signal recognition particle receptor protein [Helicobacter fennelliae]